MATANLIKPELDATFADFKSNTPEVVTKPILEIVENLINGEFDRSKLIKIGDKFPDFTMTNYAGKSVSRDDILAKGPILVTFYRGNWCPFCSIVLRGLEKHAAEFEAAGVQLVAVSLEMPDQTHSTKEQLELKFEVFTDEGPELAKKLGATFSITATAKPIYRQLDLERRNGDSSYILPIASNYMVDRSGIVRTVFADPDFAVRLEPIEAVQ